MNFYRLTILDLCVNSLLITTNGNTHLQRNQRHRRPRKYTEFNSNVYLRSKSGKGNVKQTATQKSASDFGRASTLVKAIRLALFPILQEHSENAFYRRFTSKVNAATQTGNPQPKGSRYLIDGDLTLLDNIDSNTASPFGNYCSIRPTLQLTDTRQLNLALPEFVLRDHIAKPAGAGHAELVFLITAIKPQTNAESHAELFRLALPLHAVGIATQEWTTAALPEAHVVVAASAVFYYRNNNLAGMVALIGKEWHPCEVRAVLMS